MVRLRQLVFYVFAAIYLVACPWLLSSAFGVVWAPGSAGGLERTGLLSISTLPSDATVFVSNRRYRDRTPMLLRGLQPGSYPVQVVLKGYRPWARLLTIAAGKATVLDRLVLLPQRSAFQTRVRAAYEGLLPIGDSEGLILLARGARLADAMAYTSRRDAVHPLLPPESPWAGTILRSFVSVPHGREMLWRLAEASGERYLWLNPERVDESAEDLTRLFIAPPDVVRWEGRHPQMLWVLRGPVLDRVDREHMTLAPAVAEHVRGFAVHGGSVCLLQEDARLQRLSETGERLSPLPERHQPQAEWLAGARQVELTPLGEEWWVLRDERGALGVNRPGQGVLASDIRGVAAHPGEPLAAIWTTHALGLLEPTEAGGGERAMQVRWLLKDRTQIQRVFWIAEGDYLVIQDGTTLLLAQQWRTPYLTLDPLLDLKDGTAPAWLEGTGSLYYLDPLTSHLMTFELIPERYFSLLRFPRVRPEAAGAPEP